MNIKIVFFTVISSVVLFSWGVTQEDYDKLQVKNEKLKIQLNECKIELDEFKFGAERLIVLIEKEYLEKNYSMVKKHIKELDKRHPESSKNSEFKQLLKTIENEELIEKKRKETEEAERIRLVNINNTGMWRFGHYVDDFGEPTEQGYIYNGYGTIQGTFNNSATHRSALNVRVLISNHSSIYIMLYEYANSLPVTAYSRTQYRVLIQDKDGNRYRLYAYNHSERLSFNEEDSKKVHNILLKGGVIKFKIIETGTPTEYNFTITNADYYDNAFKKL